jgi:hypothetical protein
MHRLTLAFALTLSLTSCSHLHHAIIRPDHNPPTLRTRPHITGPRNVIDLACVAQVNTGKLEWFDGPNGTKAWCDVEQQANGTFDVHCHDISIKHLPSACLMVKAQ